MKKIGRILKGWGKAFGLISISSAEAKLAELRMDKCKRCQFAKESKILEFLNGNAEYVDCLKCDKCGCPVKEKALVVDEKCPVNKW